MDGGTRGPLNHELSFLCMHVLCGYVTHSDLLLLSSFVPAQLRSLLSTPGINKPSQGHGVSYR